VLRATNGDRGAPLCTYISSRCSVHSSISQATHPSPSGDNIASCTTGARQRMLGLGTPRLRVRPSLLDLIVNRGVQERSRGSVFRLGRVCGQFRGQFRFRLVYSTARHTQTRPPQTVARLVSSPLNLSHDFPSVHQIHLIWLLSPSKESAWKSPKISMALSFPSLAPSSWQRI
jgi:hypothetical protein